MDDLICPHCENEIEKLRRTGNKRYSCTGCSKVVKHDLIKPYLEEDAVEVNDMRDEVGKDKEKDKEKSSNSSSDSGENPNPAMSQSATPDDREIIRQEGREGLKRIKKRKLEDWLQSTDGVGGKTLNRILMVFEEEEMYSEEPDTLFSLLDDELSATSSYINTVVNSVFSPEYDHQDLLQQQGYEPFFAQGGQRQNTGAQGMNGRNNRGQSQNQRQQPPQQQGGQPQQQSGGNSLSREEALQMIQASQEDEDGGGSRRRGPATDALDAATEEAIQNMASNMGGLMGTAQRLLENTLMSYFEDNPEKLVENMDLIQTFMEDDTNNNTTSQETQSKSKENAKIDNALDNVREQQGLDPNNSDTTQNTSDSSTTFTEPEQDNSGVEEDNETAEPSFEPDPEIMEGGGADPETQEDGPVSQDNNWNTANGAEPDYEDEESTDEQDNSISGEENNDTNETQTDGDDGEDDWFDQEFGEVGVEG